jgi:hypothetical protein
VVVELKRDEDGGHMELQALRYAAMVSAMTFDQAVATLARHRKEDEAAARAAILAHLGWTTPEEDAFAKTLGVADRRNAFNLSWWRLRAHAPRSGSRIVRA